MDQAAGQAGMAGGSLARRRHQAAIEKKEITGLKHSQKQISDVNLPFEKKQE